MNVNIQPPQNSVGVNVPLPPANPPTTLDVQFANAYIAHLKTAYRVQNANTNSVKDITAAQEYHQALIAARAEPGGFSSISMSSHDFSAAVAPPWFAPAIAQALAPIHRKLFILQNELRGDGSYNPFCIILFADGTHPVNDHNLPALCTLNDIKQLTDAETTAYIDHYAIHAPPHATFDRKRVLIADHIGCMAD